MTTSSQPIPPRVSKTADELKAVLTKALQAHPECQGIKVIRLKSLEESQGLANWDAEYSADPGVTISAECKRAFLSAKQGVQKRFDLAGES